MSVKALKVSFLAFFSCGRPKTQSMSLCSPEKVEGLLICACPRRGFLRVIPLPPLHPRPILDSSLFPSGY